MATARTVIIMNNRGQVLRLPEEVAFPASVNEVDIIANGNQRLIVPAGGAWDSWFDGPGATEDFMAERDQPGDQEREHFRS